jgi:hypothetical protein
MAIATNIGKSGDSLKTLYVFDTKKFRGIDAR